MGNTTSYILGYGEKKCEDIPLLTKTTTTSSTQTDPTFTQRLTDYTDTVESSETFEETCEICDNGSEKKAVGICKTCRQYMCFQCCKIHENIFSTKSHQTISKQEVKTEMLPKSKYMQRLVPVSHGFFIKDTKVDNMFKIGLFNVPSSKCILCWLPRNDRNIFVDICCVDKQSGYPSTVSRGYDDSSLPKKTKCHVYPSQGEKPAYFVIVKDIPERWNGYENTTVYKFCNTNKVVDMAFTFHGISHSVVLYDGGLALSVYIKTGFSSPDWHIRCVDYDGNIKKQFCYDGKGNPLFEEPRHLAANPSEDILFVSDYKQNCVISLDIQGCVLFKLKHEIISQPLGITCDEENNVYVACGKSVVQIQRDGTKCQTLLTSTENSEIVDVCYNPISNQLAVAENAPKATIFTFLS